MPADFAKPGDLGALVLTSANQAVGMIVEVWADAVLALPIQPILDALNVELVTEPLRFRRTVQAKDELSARLDTIGQADQLGFTAYVDAFQRLIQDSQPPLTIGIYGAWGSGKSFLMDKIAAALNPDYSTELPHRLSLWQRTRRWFKRLKPPLYPILWFRAWDYNGNDKLWAGLVERIFLVFEEGGWDWGSQLRINFWRNVQQQWRFLRPRLLPYTLFAIVGGGFFIVCK